jgi:hypothetical protein
MLIYTYQKSKKKKTPAKKVAEYQQWLDNLPTTSFSKGIKKPKTVEAYKPPKAHIRETPNYPSLATAGDNCTKPIHGKVYTGDKMIGIGTLHKSNAVPIFSDDDAKDQALMRR